MWYRSSLFHRHSADAVVSSQSIARAAVDECSRWPVNVLRKHEIKAASPSSPPPPAGPAASRSPSPNPRRPVSEEDVEDEAPFHTLPETAAYSLALPHSPVTPAPRGPSSHFLQHPAVDEAAQHAGGSYAPLRPACPALAPFWGTIPPLFDAVRGGREGKHTGDSPKEPRDDGEEKRRKGAFPSGKCRADACPTPLAIPTTTEGSRVGASDAKRRLLSLAITAAATTRALDAISSTSFFNQREETPQANSALAIALSGLESSSGTARDEEQEDASLHALYQRVLKAEAETRVLEAAVASSSCGGSGASSRSISFPLAPSVRSSCRPSALYHQRLYSQSLFWSNGLVPPPCVGCSSGDPPGGRKASDAVFYPRNASLPTTMRTTRLSLPLLPLLVNPTRDVPRRSPSLVSQLLEPNHSPFPDEDDYIFRPPVSRSRQKEKGLGKQEGTQGVAGLAPLDRQRLALRTLARLYMGLGDALPQSEGEIGGARLGTSFIHPPSQLISAVPTPHPAPSKPLSLQLYRSSTSYTAAGPPPPPPLDKLFLAYPRLPPPALPHLSARLLLLHRERGGAGRRFYFDPPAATFRGDGAAAAVTEDDDGNGRRSYDERSWIQPPLPEVNYALGRLLELLQSATHACPHTRRYLPLSDVGLAVDKGHREVGKTPFHVTLQPRGCYSTLLLHRRHSVAATGSGGTRSNAATSNSWWSRWGWGPLQPSATTAATAAGRSDASVSIPPPPSSSSSPPSQQGGEPPLEEGEDKKTESKGIEQRCLIFSIRYDLHYWLGKAESEFAEACVVVSQITMHLVRWVQEEWVRRLALMNTSGRDVTVPAAAPPPSPPWRVKGDGSVDGFSLRRGSVREDVWTTGMQRLLAVIEWCVHSSVILQLLEDD